jgi:hypothetical protein
MEHKKSKETFQRRKEGQEIEELGQSPEKGRINKKEQWNKGKEVGLKIKGKIEQKTGKIIKERKGNTGEK